MNESPFRPRTVLGLVAVGAIAFVALLWFLGNGGGNANNGGGHASGRGLNGFAGLVAMLEADDVDIRRARRKDALKDVGLLVLTPPAEAKGEDIAKIVNERRMIGPTLVVTPKWVAAPVDQQRKAKVPRGWTELVGTEAPRWNGFHDDIAVRLTSHRDAPAGGWRAIGRAGRLPDDRQVLSGEGKALIPLVRSGDGRILAAFLDDDGYYPALNDFAGIDHDVGGDDDGLYPVIFVFEPDLLDNWGLADRGTALMARELVLAAADGTTQPVTFDLTLNGLGASRNLLSLAFEPPFLAATICLLLAMVAVGWRAFCRFGPARQQGRAIALGKTALVENAAGLIRRAGRVHLVTGPYADAVRDRLIAALGLPRGHGGAEAEAMIDRAQERRGLSGPPFSELANKLRATRKPHEVARRAAALQQIEKDLT